MMRRTFSFLTLGALLALVLPLSASAATLSLSPANASVSVGETIMTSIIVSSPAQALNAVSGTISFSTDTLQVVSLSKTNSIASLWVQQPSFSNTDGTVSFEGVVLNPGFTGAAGTVLTITFRAKATGVAAITYTAGSVLANDGQGTELLTGTNGASVAIHNALLIPSAPTVTAIVPSVSITSSSHPDQTKWYTATHVAFDWTSAEGMTAVRLGYDQNPDGTPQVLYTDPTTHKELDLQDGVWYFHVQGKGSGGWGSVSTYRVQIDTMPPLLMTIQFPNSATTTANTIAVSFGTTDALSGIDHYDLSLDGLHSVISADEGNGIYVLPAGAVGSHRLRVTAYDKADNTTVTEGSFTTMGSSTAPPFSVLAWLTAGYLSLGLLIIAAIFLLLVISWYLWHRFHAFRRRYPGTAAHAHQVLREQFDELTDAVVEEVMTLEKVRTKRELTHEEERVVANLKKLIKKTEFQIENNIERPASAE